MTSDALIKRFSDRYPKAAIHLAVPAAITSLAVVGNPSAAQAIQFNFTYQPGTSIEQIAATELAGSIWSSYLTNDVVVNLHIGMTDNLSSGRLGGATPGIKKTNYDKYIEGLRKDGTADTSLMSTSARGSNQYSVITQDGRVKNNYYELNLTTANNKALGNDISAYDSNLDGFIQLDNSTNWSYGYASIGNSNNQYDFTSVVLHEIGHTLGFISGVDRLSTLDLPTGLDMFRYSEESAANGAIDLRAGETTYFSTDGGQSAFEVEEGGTTKTALFATGENVSLGGDGDQASHWKGEGSESALGIMSARVDTGEVRQISSFDLTAMDYIGWEVDHNAEVDLASLLSASNQKANQVWSSYQQGRPSAIKNRSSDVDKMLETSGIYDLGYGALFQTEANAGNAQDVPEPSSIIALLGIGLLYVGARGGRGTGNELKRTF